MWEDSLHDTEHAEEIGVEYAVNCIEINVDDGTCESNLFSLDHIHRGE